MLRSMKRIRLLSKKVSIEVEKYVPALAVSSTAPHVGLGSYAATADSKL